jgi:predicted anti-sigma-YlaC factor YlaD
MKNKVLCKEVMSHICESLGEDFNSPKCKAIKEHLTECPECIKYFKSVERTIEFYKSYNCELSQETHKRLMDSLGLNDIDN